MHTAEGDGAEVQCVEVGGVVGRHDVSVAASPQPQTMEVREVFVDGCKQ